MSRDPFCDEMNRLMAAAQSGDSAAEAHLFDLVYPYLCAYAGQRPDPVLQSTDPVIVAYHCMLREYSGGFPSWADFLAGASLTMHCVLADRARHARILELIYMEGLTITEAAGVLGIDQRTCMREHLVARAILLKELCDAETP